MSFTAYLTKKGIDLTGNPADRIQKNLRQNLQARMLMSLGPLLVCESPLNKVRRLANDVRRAQSCGVANHAQEAIPGLRHAVVGHARRNELTILFSYTK